MTYIFSARQGVAPRRLAAALAGSLLAYSAALAQSTGSQAVEEVVVTARKAANVSGLIVCQEAPKEQVGHHPGLHRHPAAGTERHPALNQTPGLNFTNDDPYGMSGGGGHLRLRGFDGSRVSLLIDGVPLNDTGNYAIYPGELIDPEVVSQVNVNVGSTDVDSPTASAVGGLININSLTPTNTFQGFLNGTVGTYNYRRISGLVQTGEFGPRGTKAGSRLRISNTISTRASESSRSGRSTARSTSRCGIPGISSPWPCSMTSSASQTSMAWTSRRPAQKLRLPTPSARITWEIISRPARRPASGQR